MKAPIVGMPVTLEKVVGPCRIIDVHSEDEGHVRIRLPTGETRIVSLSIVTPVLTAGSEIVHQPPSVGQRTFGHGIVQGKRKIAGRHQILADFPHAQTHAWVPLEHVHATPPLRMRFGKGFPLRSGDNERFRLRNLAYALEQWHANTGAMTRLEIDPLPHQIHLAHRVLTSGNLNWMIADDVGLGKTIEVGLIVSALMAQRRKRFLFIVPAGLTRQWKEELEDKFSIDDAMIYGDDFNVESPNQWKLFDRVIVSMDRVKKEAHLANFLQAEPWDMIIVDEAHRLSRTEYGNEIRSTERFTAVATLRSRTEALLLLTGTPHQGKDDKFRALLELLRPGTKWRERFANLRGDPELLADIVIRNRKAHVTDADGNFIFRGKDVQTAAAPTNEEGTTFDAALTEYVREGYQASAKGKTTTKAIGFVMTTYRKLAASSYAAIATALERRMGKLNGELSEALPLETSNWEEQADERFVEDDEAKIDRISTAREFFDGERDRLHPLLEQARHLAANDVKVAWLIENVIHRIKQHDPATKLLIFTEYRTTQDHVATALRERFGPESVAIIRGGQSIKDRRREIDAFHQTADFLISTEAGSEGLNLHRASHIMINFDLPWNPMRLVQRVGRLYRYGQEKRVQVVNVHAPTSADDMILFKMYERLEAVARDMAGVGDLGEGSDGLREDILGSVVSHLDVKQLLEQAKNDQQRTEEDIERAIELARKASENEEKLLQYASGFDSSFMQGQLPLGIEHLKAFAAGACHMTGVEITEKTYGGDVWNVRLPAHVAESIGAKNTVQRIAFTRDVARKAARAQLFGPEHPLYRFLFDAITHYDEAGLTANLGMANATACLAALLRWNDSRGNPTHQEYVVAVERPDGDVELNPRDWAEYLLAPPSTEVKPPKKRDEAWAALTEALEKELGQRSTRQVHPDAMYTVAAASAPHETSEQQ